MRGLSHGRRNPSRFIRPRCPSPLSRKPLQWRCAPVAPHAIPSQPAKRSCRACERRHEPWNGFRPNHSRLSPAHLTAKAPPHRPFVRFLRPALLGPRWLRLLRCAQRRRPLRWKPRRFLPPRQRCLFPPPMRSTGWSLPPASTSDQLSSPLMVFRAHGHQPPQPHPHLNR